MDKKVWYMCDPKKNIECKKTGCKYNKDSVYPVCDRTSHIKYSVDGIPIEEGK